MLRPVRYAPPPGFDRRIAPADLPASRSVIHRAAYPVPTLLRVSQPQLYQLCYFLL